MIQSTPWDERRNIAILPTSEKAIDFAVHHWVTTAIHAIETRGRFTVALSGGSTPKAIYQHLSHHASRLDWTKVFLFWSDERSVPPDHPESNYRMAMDAGFAQLPILPHHIYRMQAEASLFENAKAYATTLSSLHAFPFDLVMLGVGEDGHTASLFPHTEALHNQTDLVTANFVPEKKSWRMTLTLRAINESRQAVLYAFGTAKETIVSKVLHSTTDLYPASCIGTSLHRALWILDAAAAHNIQRGPKTRC